MTEVLARFKVAGHPAANWTAGNPVLLVRELGFETDTRKSKLGDGTTAWNSLSYITATWGSITGTLSAQTDLQAALDAKAAVSHTHTIANVTSLQAALDAKAPLAAPSFTGGITVTNNALIAHLVSTTARGSGLCYFDFADPTGQKGYVGYAGSGNDDFYLTNLLATPMYFVTNSTSFYAIATNGHFLPQTDNTQNLGGGANRFAIVYAGTGTINTSDKRDKQNIGAIPDEWLDAWGDVQWSRFKFKAAVKEKGDDARWHVGLVAQQVHEAFKARGIDAFTIGLCCFDEWPEEQLPVFRNGRPTKATKLRPAGSAWGLRYDECNAMEAAWQRREIATLRALVKRLNSSTGEHDDASE